MMRTGVLSVSEAARLEQADLLRKLATRSTGLSEQEARDRLRRDGPNDVPTQRTPGAVRQFVGQLTHFFAVMLWVAAALAFVGGLPELGWAVIVVVIVNGVFSFVQEYRADRATLALARLAPDRARVLRGGVVVEVPAREVVLGDVLVLREGDRICADGCLLSAEGLRINQALLTGESDPVPRDTERTGESDPDDLSQLRGVVVSGTFVASGSGTAVVVATGAATRLSSIVGVTSNVVRRASPLRAELDRAVRVIAAVAVGTGVVFFIASLGLGLELHAGFLFAVGVIVALVPEGLLPTMTLSLARSATRMAQHGALVRRLEAVETLGSTTVICTDKTGTITMNEMTVQAVVTADATFDVGGQGYGPQGGITNGGRPLAPAELDAVRPLLETATLCGESHVEEVDGRWTCLGDPTEGALTVLATKGGVGRIEAERSLPLVKTFAYTSDRGCMSTVHAAPSGGFAVLMKGAPEVVFPACGNVGPGWGERVESLAGRGMRVLALARKNSEAVPADAADAETGMILLGLVGLEDPVRAGVRASLQTCERAGIRVLMVTGDHPGTAMVIANRAGLVGSRSLLGSELPQDDMALQEALQDPELCVLARISPEQKLRIAGALIAAGEVVAMTGDGVNDAPALRQADIGVAMGEGGTDVAREAADLVLLDDDFSHIVEAVEEGRAVFANIKRFLTYHLTDNVAELAPFVLWALSGGRIPLLISVLQVLALDIGTDLLPALALGAEPPEPGLMQMRPRSRTARLLDRRVLGRAFGFLGPLEAVLSLGAAAVVAADLAGGAQEVAILSTVVFSSIVLMQMANALECRSTPASLVQIGPFSNRLMLWAVASELVALAAFVLVPFLRELLGMHLMPWWAWGVVWLTPSILLVLEESRKALIRGAANRRRPQPRRSLPRA